MRESVGRSQSALLRRENDVQQRVTLAGDFEAHRERETLPMRHGLRSKTACYPRNMANLHHLSDAELLSRMPALVLVEHGGVSDVVEHLAEIDRRRLYLEQGYPSLYAYAREYLCYTEDAALKRIRVARLALEFPQVLDELRTGAIQLAALVMLAPHLKQDNAAALLTEARRKSRTELAQLLARWFPRPDVPPSLELLGADADGKAFGAPPRAGPSGRSAPITRPEADPSAAQSRLEPLSPERYLVQFTASADLHAKLTRVRELLSHSVPSGELALLVERALDALIEREVKRRTGAGKPRKRRELKPGSRHIPREVERQVRERDGNQCTFTSAEGKRCQERRFLTLEHRIPFAFGGLPTVENLAVFCMAHNAHSARRVFGEKFIAEKRKQRAARAEPAIPEAPAKPDLFEKVKFALCKMGFRERDVRQALTVLHRERADIEAEPLLRAALGLLTPAPTTR